MANEKRKRSANWMASEKSLLVDLVSEHFHIIENKRTDGVSMKQKLVEWIIISNKYNSQTMLSHRTADNLKAQWESLKKSTKKEASSRRMHLIQTGGGPSRSVFEDPLQQRILCLITPSAVGLHNPFDSDNITTEHATHAESLPDGALVNVINTIPGPEVENKYSPNSVAPPIVPTVIENCLLNENELPVVLVPSPANKSPDPEAQVMTNNNDDTNADYIVDWGDYTPKALRTPISKPLRWTTEQNRRPTNAEKRLDWMSKRRPQLSTSSLEKLHELKGSAITIQMEHAAKEREEARELFKSQMDIQKGQMDIQKGQMDIQKEILRQEKIKTRLLLLELRRNKNNK